MNIFDLGGLRFEPLILFVPMDNFPFCTFLVIFAPLCILGYFYPFRTILYELTKLAVNPLKVVLPKNFSLR